MIQWSKICCKRVKEGGMCKEKPKLLLFRVKNVEKEGIVLVFHTHTRTHTHINLSQNKG